MSSEKTSKINKNWEKELTPEQFKVCREKATERPFTGKYLDNKEAGEYVCVCCGNELFSSDTKFDSGSGWPSFFAAMNKENVQEIDDDSHFMRRTEVVCGKCQAHLGHVFPDGPKPTGLRYCINSVALDFKKK